MDSEKTKVVVLAVVCLLLLGAVGAVFFLSVNKKTDENASPQPGTPMAAAAPPSAAPQLLEPPTPAPAQLAVPVKAVEKDPLGGGAMPKRARAVKPPPPPAEVKVFELPPIAPEKNRLRRGGWRMGGGATPGTPGGGTPVAANERAKPAPIGRHAGWVYNTNGQIWAIFEDSDGAARAVRVGDEIGGYTIKAIAQDYIILADGEGKEQKIKLQGLDTFQGKPRGVTIDAAPGAAGANPGGGPANPVPAWGP